MDIDAPIIFWLPWPPTVNDYWKPIRGSLYLSRRGRMYKEAACQAVAEQLPGINLDGRIMAEVTLHPPDARVRDVDNYSKGLLDAITASALWADDAQVDQLFVYRGETVKQGCVRVELSPAGPIVPFDLGS